LALLSEQIDGKYEILGKLREGGMGSLYKVRHRLLDEVRVVKVIRSRPDAVGEEGADRFLAEARAATKLRHPNVAVLHDFAAGEDGQAFIVMEYIDGWNLLEVLNGFGPPPVPLTLEIARQSLKALGYLHRHKIVHRDVSPDNLMLTRDVDGHPLVKLIDLGIAKALEGQGGLTTTGVFLGKPRYGSPERFSGTGWDERSDLYSFGVVLYELLTGRPRKRPGDRRPRSRGGQVRSGLRGGRAGGGEEGAVLPGHPGRGGGEDVDGSGAGV
jgi:serine/threonine-protein kinase